MKAVFVLTSDTYKRGTEGPLRECIVGIFDTPEGAENYRDNAVPRVTDGHIEEWCVEEFRPLEDDIDDASLPVDGVETKENENGTERF